jgi:hypothetical protein
MFFDDTPMAGGTPTDDTAPIKDDADKDEELDDKGGDSDEAM